ncbi:hypothetical protein N4P33_15760 [Streptomyces sp. 15-116A]|uniref:hypothetical protein n=1 Tax=Streptomyces sp. 15-116A TaxID=2259035 RepID=UPI0021B3CF98|nr:hypothetical protein [Streptomyces sp. 15-116A]MCT7353618.1 hypothetical protein [Streptomyces sp. 15-116A]
MNARKARLKRAAERARTQAALDAMASATPQLVGSHGGHDYFKVGDALVLVPVLLDRYPPELKAAVDRRRRASLTGSCDCGGGRRLDRKSRVVHTHENDCPAADDNLNAIAEQYGLAFDRVF